jgi:hypothetical protein
MLLWCIFGASNQAATVIMDRIEITLLICKDNCSVRRLKCSDLGNGSASNLCAGRITHAQSIDPRKLWSQLQPKIFRRESRRVGE